MKETKWYSFVVYHEPTLFEPPLFAVFVAATTELNPILPEGGKLLGPPAARRRALENAVDYLRAEMAVGEAEALNGATRRHQDG